jgi:cytochrome c oxidase subunit III
LTVVVILISRRILKFKFIEKKIETYYVFNANLTGMYRCDFDKLFFNLFFGIKGKIKKLFVIRLKNGRKPFTFPAYINIKNDHLYIDDITNILKAESLLCLNQTKNGDSTLFSVSVNLKKKFFFKIYKEDFYYILTLVLGTIFLICQGIEYIETPFHINDSVYGSAFYMLTGLHGLHVIIGVLFLTVFFVRKQFYISSNLLGLEFSAWYWHFVDVVWIFLYFVIYLGSYFSGTLI